jgi:signal transduction histidine kinase
VLDEVGLGEALARHGQRLSAALDVRVVAGVPGPLPAAVEVAAYRIATEALENVVRHAGARHATVRLTVVAKDRLRLEIADDGTGFADDGSPGVGLRSMHERAAELGGSLRVEQCCPGSRIVAELPL